MSLCHFLFHSGDERSVRAKKNIAASFFLRGTNVLVGLVLVPVLIHWLNPERYGIWLAVTSVVGWFGLADFGLGNGLRNRFAEALARGDKALARSYVSTSYVILSLIVGFLVLFFLVLNRFIDWTAILNAPRELERDIRILVDIVFVLFFGALVLRIVGVVLIASQKPAMNDLLETSSNVLLCLVILWLSQRLPGSLVALGAVSGLSYVFVFLVATVIVFTRWYRDYAPSPALVNFRYGRDLTGLGMRFFAIQVSNMILFQTDNIIIARMFGPADITPYQVALKYFSLLTMLFTIVLLPVWSASTEAYQKRDIAWMRRIAGKLFRIWLLLGAGAVLLLAVSGVFYRVWLGGAVTIPFALSAFMALFAVVYSWNLMFGYFTSGVGKIRIQLWAAVFAGIANIPLSIFFARFMGTPGVILATIVCMLPASVLLPIQYRRILAGRAGGVWDR